MKIAELRNLISNTVPIVCQCPVASECSAIIPEGTWDIVRNHFEALLDVAEAARQIISKGDCSIVAQMNWSNALKRLEAIE